MTKAITPQELYSRLQSEPFTLIDVREPNEYSELHIEASRLIPLAAFLADPASANNGNAPIVFICRSGRRSELATEKFLSLFPTMNAFNLTGGLLAWRAAALPVVENK